VQAIPQIRGIVPIIGTYLQGIIAQMNEIDESAATTILGVFNRISHTPLQTLQYQELTIRKELAYGVFDALFGKITKPLSVPQYVVSKIDPRPSNRLRKAVCLLHASLQAPENSASLVVGSDGTVLMRNSANFSTGIDPTIVRSLRGNTADFLAQALGALQATHSTFNICDALKSLDTMDQVHTFLSSPPVLIEDTPTSLATSDTPTLPVGATATAVRTSADALPVTV
jgi:hypothetical protein